MFEVSYPRSVPERRPEGHQPAAPRFSLRWPTPHLTLVSVYFGMQQDALSRADKLAFFAQIRGFLAQADGPQADEVMQCIDEAGLDNAIVVAYWTDPTLYARWLATSGFRSWFEAHAAANGAPGYWLEPVVVPYDRHETIYSASNYKVGFARTVGAEIVSITTNGFFGAARDRLPLSAVDVLESPVHGVLPPASARASARGHWIAELPHNATLLRSGQYWEGAG